MVEGEGRGQLVEHGADVLARRLGQCLLQRKPLVVVDERADALVGVLGRQRQGCRGQKQGKYLFHEISVCFFNQVVICKDTIIRNIIGGGDFFKND